MDVAWSFFLCFLDCLNLMIFLKLMTHSWRSLWRSSGKAWHGYGQTVARLWSSNGKVLEKIHGRVYGKGMAKLWQGGGDICSQVNQSFGHVIARIWQSYDRVLAKFGKVMVKLWPRYGIDYGKAMAELWQRGSDVMVELCLAP